MMGAILHCKTGRCFQPCFNVGVQVRQEPTPLAVGAVSPSVRFSAARRRSFAESTTHRPRQANVRLRAFWGFSSG